MDEGLRSELSKQGIFTTTLEDLYNWGRKNSIWPLQFGLACCAIEMIASISIRMRRVSSPCRSLGSMTSCRRRTLRFGSRRIQGEPNKPSKPRMKTGETVLRSMNSSLNLSQIESLQQY